MIIKINIDGLLWTQSDLKLIDEKLNCTFSNYLQVISVQNISLTLYQVKLFFQAIDPFSNV